MEATSPKYSVYGSWGFIGSEICSDEDFTHNEGDAYDYKNHLPSEYPDIVYCISTVDNYNVTKNDPYTDIQTNLHHLMSVLQANRQKYGNDFTITFLSSWFVYGNVELPAREDACCNPKGFYSITKRTAEQLLISYCDTFGIKWRVVRLANVMGLKDMKASKQRNALQYMVKTLCEGGEVTLYDEDCRRDYIHVEDAADAIRLIARKGQFGEIYNIGSGMPSSIHHLVDYAHRLSEYKGTIKLVPVPEFHKTVQAGDMFLEVSKLFNLGWQPKYSSTEIVEEICNHYYKKENNGQN